MNMTPISLIIPAFNVENFIKDAVESALQFTEIDEIIIVEDNSSDKTLDVCRQLEKDNPRIKVLQHEHEY